MVFELLKYIVLFFVQSDKDQANFEKLIAAIKESKDVRNIFVGCILVIF